MTKYQCPVCGKRACDSAKRLLLAALSQNNENTADVIIKCQRCKSSLAVNIAKEVYTTENNIDIQIN